MEPVGKIGQSPDSGLTVQQLIQRLSTLPADFKVWIDVDGEYFYRITKAEAAEDPRGDQCVVLE